MLTLTQLDAMANPVKPKVMVEIQIEGEFYALDKIPSESSSIVKKGIEQLFKLMDFLHIGTCLGRIGYLMRLAYSSNTVITSIKIRKISIQRLGHDITKLCDRSALTATEFKEISTNIPTDLQNTYGYLLDNKEEMAFETLSAVFKHAKQMSKAALELKEMTLVEAEKVSAAVMLALEVQGNPLLKEHDAMRALIGSLRNLYSDIYDIISFWRVMESHCHSLASYVIKSRVETVMKYPKEKRLELWTSRGFTCEAIKFYPGWFALHKACACYMERIKNTQRDLHKYITESLTYEESKKITADLYKKLIEN